MEKSRTFKELKMWQKGIEAEGFKRSHNKEYKKFLNITLGSLAELMDS